MFIRPPGRHAAPALAFCAAVTFGACLAEARAQTPYDSINKAAAAGSITVHPIRGRISMLEGSGGNITVLTGPEGVFMVDAGIAVSRQKIEAALRDLNAGPIRHLVNTHWHWDHADGNRWVRASGATLMAHPSTIAHLGDTIRIDEWGHTFTPVPTGDRPTIAVGAERTMSMNGETVRITPFDTGHTDGDLLVHFVQSDVLALGDTFWNGGYPFIDYHVGGGVDGVIRQAEFSLGKAMDGTRIVPGHGPVGSRIDLTAYRDMLVATRDRISELKRQGRTLEQVIAAKPTAAYDAKWGRSIVAPDMFTALVYKSLH